MSDTYDVGSEWKYKTGPETVTIMSVREIDTTAHFPTVVDFRTSNSVETWTLPEFVKHFEKVL